MKLCNQKWSLNESLESLNTAIGTREKSTLVGGLTKLCKGGDKVRERE